MRNKIMGLMMVATFIGQANANESKFSYGGQLRVRNDNKELTYSSSDKHNVTQLRARMEFEATLPNGTLFHVSPQGTKNYGDVQYVTNDATSNRARVTSGDKYHSRVELFEAYAKRTVGKLSYKIGRQALGYGDRIILGTRNWTAGGLAYDALKFSYKIGAGQLDLGYAHNSVGDETNSTHDDSILSFLYYKALMQKDLQLDVYFIHNNDRDSEEVKNVGFRYYQKFGNFDVRTENIYQTQRVADKKEHNLNLSLGYSFTDSFRTYLRYMQASENYNHLYTNRHLYNGIIDVVGRQNLVNYEVGAKYKLNSDFDFSLQFMCFSQKDTVGAYNQATSAVLAGDITKEHIGNEVDFMAHYKLSTQEKVSLAYSTFMHGDYFSSNPDNSRFAYLQYYLKF